mmetsp:Transcript_18310/g.28516  ORF Transcript_18310/g.28516 Transcript_18310/m.28516 type:complete len:208 (+) Transcript_18310:382-1005(+)
MLEAGRALTESADVPGVSLHWCIRRIWFDWHLEKNFPALDRAREAHGLLPKLDRQQAQDLIYQAANWVMNQIFSDFGSCLVFLWADIPALQELTDKVFLNGSHRDILYTCHCFHILQREVREAIDGPFATHVAQASFILQGFKRNANTRLADFMLTQWQARFGEQICCAVQELSQKVLAFFMWNACKAGSRLSDYSLSGCRHSEDVT